MALLVNILPKLLRRRIEHRPNLLKIADNIGWLFFDRVFRLGVGLLVGAWVARYLGPEQFGLLSFTSAFVALFGALSVLGLQNIVVRDLVNQPESAEKTMGTAAALQFFGGLFTFVLATITIRYLRPDDKLVHLMVMVLGFSMIFKAADFAKYWFEAKVRSKYIVWVINAVFLVVVVIKIILILSKATLIAFVWVAFLETAIIAVAMLVVFSTFGPGIKKLKVSIIRASSLLSDCWPLILSSLAIAVYMKIDQVMLGQMLDDRAVGIYSVAARISEVWYFVPMAIVASVFPTILEAKKKSEKLYYERLQQLYDLMVGLALVVALPMTFLSEWIIVLLFGQSYQNAGTVLAVHIWASVFVFLGVASGKWFLAENRQVLSLQRTILGAVVNVVLNLWFIRQFGVLGAAWATVISYAIAAFFSDLVQVETREMFRMKFYSLNPVRLLKVFVGSYKGLC